MDISDELIEKLFSQKVTGSDYTYKDILDLGFSLYYLLGCWYRLGVASPAGMLQYFPAGFDENFGRVVIRDFIAVTASRAGSVPGSKERLLALGEEAQGVVVANISKVFAPKVHDD